jgi:sulfite exporter TauE/SafE
MLILLGTVFLASLAGSLHCVGMCGPFAMLASASGRQRRSAVGPAIAYSLGRLLTYSLVGVAFGFAGLLINRGNSLVFGSSLSTIQQAATWLAGGLMIAVGVVALLRQLGWRVPLPSVAGGLQKFLQRQFAWVSRQPPLRKAFAIGSLTCLMPCGWLYTFAIVATGTASPAWGAVVMIAFWAGTVPVLAALMAGVGVCGQALQKRVPLAMAGIIILIGVFTITFRAPVAIAGDKPAVDGSTDLVQQVEAIDHGQLPCCSEN